MRTITSILALMLFFPALALASGVELLGPADGSEVITSPQTFIFSIATEHRDKEIMQCSLYANGVLRKTYNSFPSLTNIRMNLELERGSYMWHIDCLTQDNEALSSEQRTVDISPPPSSTDGVVKKVGAGLTSVGTRWIFDIKLLDKGPVLLTEIRPIDIIEITLKPATRSAGGFQSKDEYIEISIIRSSETGGERYLDIKARTPETRRVFESQPIMIDVDQDGKEDISFNFLGMDGKKNLVEITKIGYIPAEETAPEPVVIIDEEPADEEIMPEPADDEPEEEPVVIVDEEPEIKPAPEKSKTWIAVLIIIIAVAAILIYLYASGALRISKPPKKK